MANDELYGEEWMEWSKAHENPRRLRRLLPLMGLKPDDAVADFACGTGALMELVAPRVARYVGTDFSEPCIRAAQARRDALGIGNAEFVCATVEDFCASRGQEFDVAFAMDFSEHVADDDWGAVLQCIRGALKPGGTLYVHTPNRNFILEAMKARNFILKQFERHIAVRTPEENVRMLEEAGFRGCQCHLLAHYNVMRYVHGLSYLPWAGKWFKARVFIAATASG